jgi:hypothetical protein
MTYLVCLVFAEEFEDYLEGTNKAVRARNGTSDECI